MEIAIIAIVIGIAALFVLFVLARRMLRLAIRLSLAGLLILLLIGGGVAWWWFNPNASEQNATRPANTRRTTSR